MTFEDYCRIEASHCRWRADRDVVDRVSGVSKILSSSQYRESAKGLAGEVVKRRHTNNHTTQRQQCTMTFEECADASLIKNIVCHPAVVNHLEDDFAKAQRENGLEWEMITHPTVHYRVVRDEGEVIGLFIVCCISPILWLVHQMFLPSSWGFKSKRAGREFAKWIWTNTKVERITGEIVESNTLALRYAQQAGFEVWGVNPRCVMKDGKLQDLIHVGISRPEVK